MLDHSSSSSSHESMQVVTLAHQSTLNAVHLSEKLVDQALCGGVVVAASAGRQRVHLIKEQHTRMSRPSTSKQLPHCTLTFTNVLVQ